MEVQKLRRTFIFLILFTAAVIILYKITSQHLHLWKENGQNSFDASEFDNSKLLMERDQDFKKIRLPRIFCWITSQEKELENKLRAVNHTWVRRCDGYIFVLTTQKRLPDVVDLGVPDGREHLTAKTVKAFQYIYTHYLNDFDWFLKGDDDVFIVIENLKYLLSHYSLDTPVYTGHLFKKYHKMGYMSGGAGYVLNRPAVKILVENGLNVKGMCADDGGDEDVKMGLCIHKLGIASYDSRDKFGRETFHAYGALDHIGGPLPHDIAEYDRHPTKIGKECCSQLTISYHYNSPQMCYLIEQMLYRSSVYGRRPKPAEAFKNFFMIGTVPPLLYVPK